MKEQDKIIRYAYYSDCLFTFIYLHPVGSTLGLTIARLRANTTYRYKARADGEKGERLYANTLRPLATLRNKYLRRITDTHIWRELIPLTDWLADQPHEPRSSHSDAFHKLNYMCHLHGPRMKEERQGVCTCGGERKDFPHRRPYGLAVSELKL